MSKYIVETYYTCTFKIVHKLDELNENKLTELDKRNDGEVKIIDVKLNNRKTKTTDKKDNFEKTLKKLNEKDVTGLSSLANERIINSDKLQSSINLNNDNIKTNK